MHADDAAAVQTHVPDGNAGAALQVHHAAHAGAGFRGMSGGETGERDVFTAPEVQHLGIPGLGGDLGGHLAVAGNGQVLHVLDHQLVAVKFFLPGALFVAGVLAVGAGGGQVEGAAADMDRPVGTDGLDEFIGGRHRVDAVLRRGFCLGGLSLGRLGGGNHRGLPGVPHAAGRERK